MRLRRIRDRISNWHAESEGSSYHYGAVNAQQKVGTHDGLVAAVSRMRFDVDKEWRWYINKLEKLDAKSAWWRSGIWSFYTHSYTDDSQVTYSAQGRNAAERILLGPLNSMANSFYSTNYWESVVEFTLSKAKDRQDLYGLG